MNGSNLLELPDIAFADRWRDMPLDAKAALPDAEHAQALARFNALHGYVDAGIEHAARTADSRPAGRKAFAACRFPWEWAGDAAPVLDVPHVVKGVIPRGAFVLIYGASGSGKTFLAIDLASHVPAGIAWRGHRVPGAPAVYVASEAGISIRGRFVAVREHVLPDTFDGAWPLAIATRGPNLLNAVEVEALVEELAVIATAAEAPLGLIVIDTLSRSIPAADENSAETMTGVIAAVDRVREATGAAVALVHHTGKDASRGARGHSSLFAAADVAIEVVEKVATLTKARDGVTGEAFAFDLKVVELGRDSDGDPVTTCIVEHQEEGGTPLVPRTTGLRGHQKLLIERLCALTRKFRRNMADQGRPMEEARVSLGALRQDLDKRGMPQNRQRDALRSLQERGLVVVEGDIVAPTEAAL
jgi:hypothetical protein